MEPAAVTADSFNIVNLFLNADWVVKIVMLGLAAASLWSWAIIIDKIIRLTKLNREADQFEDKLATGRSMEDIAAEAGTDAPQPLPRMLNGALREWRDARARGALSESQSVMLIQRIDRVLDGVIARETQRVESGLGLLAIVATASPFIGLFGTVWGIMHAFQAIAVQKNTSLAVVAPAIAEALFATAIGLAAAIPAYIAYNKFSTDAGRFSGRLEGFADDLSTAIQRRLGERG
jgi:biopolymer transport protein TolQ